MTGKIFFVRGWVYRQTDVPVASLSCAAGHEGVDGHVVHLRVPYELIRSVLPTAKKALEVMGGVGDAMPIEGTG